MSSHFQVKFLKFHPGPSPNSDHFTTNTVSQCILVGEIGV